MKSKSKKKSSKQASGKKEDLKNLPKNRIGCGTVIVIVFLLLYLLGKCSGSSNNTTTQSEPNIVDLSQDYVAYNNYYSQVVRHCVYANGETIYVAPHVMCPNFLRR